ncbi:MAG: cell division protein FtsQ/DivIB [Pseudomonadota bacterium]
MPKVKRKKATRARGRKKSSSGFFIALMDRASNFAAAGVAGLTVIFAGLVALLWSGGYFGLAGERADQWAQGATIAAGLKVERITAIGYEQTSEDAILGAIGPVVGASLVHFDLHSARARVEALGWVRSAAVTRLWPNTIHVSLREREPAAIWQLSGALNLIDSSGAIIREIDAYEYSNLPLIVGAGAPDSAADVLRALRAEPLLWGKASALVRVGERRWNMRLDTGADIKFPEEGIDQAVKTLARLQDAYGLLDRPIEYVDLRDPTRLVYRERGDETGAARELEGAR